MPEDIIILAIATISVVGALVVLAMCMCSIPSQWRKRYPAAEKGCCETNFRAVRCGVEIGIVVLVASGLVLLLVTSILYEHAPSSDAINGMLIGGWLVWLVGMFMSACYFHEMPEDEQLVIG